MKLDYVIVSVTDMPASVAFYRDVLGLPLRFESPGWTEFATDGATLALHSGGGPACRPGLGVEDLDDFHRRMRQNGVRCVQEPTTVFGSRVAQYADPNGLAISVGEKR